MLNAQTLRKQSVFHLTSVLGGKNSNEIHGRADVVRASSMTSAILREVSKADMFVLFLMTRKYGNLVEYPKLNYELQGGSSFSSSPLFCGRRPQRNNRTGFHFRDSREN